MLKYLEKSGYPPQFLSAIELVPNDGANIPAAEHQIAQAVEKFLSDINGFLESNHPEIAPKIKVDLISHSMGALSSRWYTAKVRPDRVRKWISLAGANHGTNVLCHDSLKRPGQGEDDLCPAFAVNEQQSRVQFILNGFPHKADIDETPYGMGADPPGAAVVPPNESKRIIYFTIRTVEDRWIRPGESANLDGAGGVHIPIPSGWPARETSPGNFQMENGVRHDPMQHDPATMRLLRLILES